MQTGFDEPESGIFPDEIKDAEESRWRQVASNSDGEMHDSSQLTSHGRDGAE